MITEVKIGDKVSFRHKKKQVTGQVIHRHMDKEKAFLAGHVNVKIEGQPSYPVTVHVSKLKPVVKEEHTMENTVTVQDLLNHISTGNNVEAEQVLNVLLQGKVNELMSAAKVEVAQEMFNTQECADCEAEEVDEALIGGQKNLDKNHNGKLDKQDFKMLRAKKGMKEETEELEEGNAENKAKKNAFVKNLGHRLSGSSLGKAHTQSGRNALQNKPSGYHKDDIKTVRDKKFKMPYSAASEKKVTKEEVETLDEYQKGLFNPPAGFTKKGIEKGKGVKTTYHYAGKKSTTPVGATMNLGGVKIDLGKKGVKKKGVKNVLTHAPVRKEEVEQVDELKKSTLGSYVKKAASSMRSLELKHNLGVGKARYTSGTSNLRKIKNREKGINTAVDKLTKEEVAQVDEATLSAKAARAGKDIGKKGKSFKKIAASAGKHYGSKEKGQKVAGAILKKLRAKHGK